jgi:hypothetical protein
MLYYIPFLVTQLGVVNAAGPLQGRGRKRKREFRGSVRNAI